MAADNEVQILLTAKDQASQKLKDLRTAVKAAAQAMEDANEEYKKTGDPAALARLDKATKEWKELAAAQARASKELAVANRKMKEFGSQSQSAAAKAAGAWKKVAGVFSNDLVAGLSAAGLVMFGKQAVDASARVEDSTAALTTTFGSVGQGLVDWAKQSGDAFNLSQAQALEAAQAFATFGQSAGLTGQALQTYAIDLTERAADMASYYGGSVTDALDAIRSGLAGETEPLKRYAVMLDDATMRQKALSMELVDTTSSALAPQTKALVAQSLILEKTSAAQDDVARTSDSMGNRIKDAQQQMEDFKVTAGETVAVGLGPLLDLTNGAMDAFNGLPKGIQQTAIAIGAIGAAALIATPRIMALKASMESTGTSAKAMGVMALRAGAAGAAIAGVGTVIGSLVSYYQEGQQSAADFAASFDDVTGASTEATAALIQQRLATEGIDLLGRQVGVSTAEMVRAIMGEGNARQDLTAELSGQSVEANELGRKLGLLSDEHDSAAAAAKANAAAERDLWTQAERTAEAIDAQTSRILENTKARIAARGGVLAWRQAQLDLNEAIDGFTKKLTTADGRFKPFSQKAINAERAMLDFADNGVTRVSKAFDGGNFARGMRILDQVRGKLIKAAEAAGMSDEQARDYADSITRIPKQWRTVLELDDTEAAADLKHFLDTLPNYVPINIALGIASNSSLRGQIPGAATGGLIAGPGTGTSDSVPMMLSNGEYVVRAAAVRAVGVDTLERINRADVAPVPVIPVAPIPVRGGDGATAAAPHGGAVVNIGAIHAESGVDVESSVLHALLRADRVSRERR